MDAALRDPVVIEIATTIVASDLELDLANCVAADVKSQLGLAGKLRTRCNLQDSDFGRGFRSRFGIGFGISAGVGFGNRIG